MWTTKASGYNVCASMEAMLVAVKVVVVVVAPAAAAAAAATTGVGFGGEKTVAVASPVALVGRGLATYWCCMNRQCDDDEVGNRYYLLAAKCPSNMIVYISDGSAQTIVRAATLRQNLQIKSLI